MAEEHPQARDDRRFGDQEGVVSGQQVPRTAGMGRRPATPSATVRAGPAVTTRRWHQERVIVGALSGWTQITSASAARALIT